MIKTNEYHFIIPHFVLKLYVHLHFSLKFLIFGLLKMRYPKLNNDYIYRLKHHLLGHCDVMPRETALISRNC